jgi:hypothetical protein
MGNVTEDGNITSPSESPWLVRSEAKPDSTSRSHILKLLQESTPLSK